MAFERRRMTDTLAGNPVYGSIQAGDRLLIDRPGEALPGSVDPTTALTLDLTNVYTRAGAEAVTIPVLVVVLVVQHGGMLLQYVRDASGTALQTGDGQWWSPAGGIATPGHWLEGLPGYANDATAAVQAAYDWVRTTYDTNVGDFTGEVNFARQVWRCTGPIDATLIRQPNFRHGNGTLFFDMTGGLGVETWGSNSMILLPTFKIEGTEDPDACPAALYCMGVCEEAPGVFGIAPAHKGTLYVDGNVSMSHVFDIGSEESGLVIYGDNSHPSDTAYVYFNSGNMQDIVDIYGSALTSPFCTLLTVARGSVSNILDTAGSSSYKRSALWNATITGLSQADPVVCQFTVVNTVQTDRMADGQEVWLSNGGGMTEVQQRKHTIAALTVAGDGLSGSFELSGEDGLGHTAYSTGGAVHRATGPAIFAGSGNSINIGPASYILAHHYTGVHLHCRNGPVSQFRCRGQFEKNIPYLIDIDVGTIATAIQGLELDTLSAAQVIKAPYRLLGSGTLDLRDLKFTANSQAAAFADGLCANGAGLSVRNADIRVPNPLDVSGLAAFTGVVFEQAPQRIRIYSSKTKYLEIAAGAVLLNGDVLAVQAEFAAADFQDISHAVNTRNKTRGAVRYDTTTAQHVYAAGGTAGGVWLYQRTGATAYTPV